MSKLNQEIKKIQNDITELDNYTKGLQIKEPEAYQNEIEEINEKMKGLNIKHLKALIEVYKKQNPDKYKTKKAALNAKLEYLKQGGDPKIWNYSTWKMTQEVKPSVNGEVKSEIISTPVPEITTKPATEKK